MSKKTAIRGRSAKPSAPAPQSPGVGIDWGVAAALAAGVIPALLALAHFPFINGTPYWPWRYYDGNPLPFAAAALAVWAALAWADERAAAGRSLAVPLALIAVLHVALIIGFTALSDRGLAIVGERVSHPDITSYHTEATRIDSVGEWLAEYPDRLRGMIGHAQTHPPGPILYYRLWNGLLGPEAGAQWGGVFLALLGGLAIPLLFRLVVRVTGSELAGFSAAAAWTPMPAVIHMLGSFDTAYPLFTLGLAILWIGACWDGDRRSAAGCGALLWAALLFTHGLLTLGALFVLLAMTPLALGAPREGWPARAVTAAGVGAVTCLGLFALLWLTTGYNHAAALLESMRIQDGLAGAWDRPWRLTVAWDVYDFFLASGWATFGIVALYVIRRARRGEGDWRERSFVIAALGTIAVVDLSGLLRAETARVWLFLQPLALAVVGMELARWTPGQRLAAYAVLLLALVAIRSSMIFL